MNKLEAFKQELEKELSDSEKWAYDTCDDSDIGIVTEEKIALRILDKYMNNTSTEEATQVLQRLESLENEYNAYHFDNDYWRGIKYAIDVMRR